MIYCFDTKLNFEYTEAEIILAKCRGKVIFYDNSQDAFLDDDLKHIDIKGMKIFSRTGSTQIYDINYAIIRHGGYPVVSNVEIDKVISWPKYVDLKRKVGIFKGRDLINPDTVSQIEKEYGENIFFKTKVKDFADTIDTSLLKTPECAFYRALEEHLDDEFFISEAVEVLEDDLGIEEYRVFVIDGDVANISRMTTEVFHKISDDVVGYAKELVSRLQGNFPKCYSFDIFRVRHNGEDMLDVSEFNPIHAAGPYLYNSIIDVSDDLNHDDIRHISREFLSSIDECRYEGPVINNRDNTYKIPHSFSTDLRSLAIQGHLGLTFTTMKMSKNFYANTKPLFTFACPIEDDDDLKVGSFNLVSSEDDLLTSKSSEETDDMINKVNKLLSIHKKG